MNDKTDARSAIVKYLKDNPSATAPQIIKALGLQKSNGAKLLMRMWGDGVLNRRDTLVQGIDSTGNFYRNKSFAYTVAKTLVPAGIKNSPGYYRHRPDSHNHVRPTNQGGQGALRGVVGVQSSAGMI